jgi:hypothetical protein
MIVWSDGNQGNEGNACHLIILLCYISRNANATLQGQHIGHVPKPHGAYTLIHERNVLQKFDMSNHSKSFGVCIK